MFVLHVLVTAVKSQTVPRVQCSRDCHVQDHINHRCLFSVDQNPIRLFEVTWGVGMAVTGWGAWSIHQANPPWVVSMEGDALVHEPIVQDPSEPHVSHGYMQLAAIWLQPMTAQKSALQLCIAEGRLLHGCYAADLPEPEVEATGCKSEVELLCKHHLLGPTIDLIQDGEWDAFWQGNP